MQRMALLVAAVLTAFIAMILMTIPTHTSMTGNFKVAAMHQVNPSVSPPGIWDNYVAQLSAQPAPYILANPTARTTRTLYMDGGHRARDASQQVKPAVDMEPQTTLSVAHVLRL